MEDSNVSDEDEAYEKRVEDGRIQLCFDIIKDSYYYTFKNRDNLDEKASKIIVFSGIIVSLYSGFGGIILKDISKTDVVLLNKYYLLLFILATGLISLIISILLALVAFKPEAWKSVPSPNTFIEKYAKPNKSKEEILGPLTSTMADTISINNEKNIRKAKYIKYSLYLLAFGLVISVIFIFTSLLI
jgi:hypothetical protein